MMHTTCFSDPEVNLQELGVAVHAITGALKHFFTQLPQPLIPEDCTKRINEIMSKLSILIHYFFIFYRMVWSLSLIPFSFTPNKLYLFPLRRCDSASVHAIVYRIGNS